MYLLQLAPATQAVGPAQLKPPHCPYNVWLAPPEVVVAGGAVVVVRVVVVVDLVVDRVVEPAVVVVGEVPPPPAGVGVPVAVMAEDDWAIDAACGILAGPGMM